MNKESFYKLLLMLGGGFVAFMLLKPKGDAKSKNTSNFTSTSKSANGSPKPVTDEDRENAEIVMTAYVMAMEAGESPQNISQLNSETMKEFGLRCYADKQGSLVVCNVNGTEVLKA